MRAATVDDDLRRVVDAEVAGRTGRRVVAVERRPHPYRTSFPLEELDVQLDDEARLELVFKDLSFERLELPARLAKGSGRHDPRRELQAYRMLDGAGLGTPKLYAAFEGDGRHWLIVERVPGVPLWQFGEREVWRAAAAWLARLHRRFHGTNPPPGSSLVVHDGDTARTAMHQALIHAPRRTRAVLERIAGGHREIADWLEHAPRTLVHGDFHASNVLVDMACRPPRIAPADWELAGFGPGLLDLASLTAGRWSERERAALVAAYANATGRPTDDEWLADLERCRLLHAISLLALPPGWRPPPEHEHDWLGEATAAAERLEII